MGCGASGGRGRQDPKGELQPITSTRKMLTFVLDDGDCLRPSRLGAKGEGQLPQHSQASDRPGR